MLTKVESDIIDAAEDLCKKFVDKVETGKARSRVTYAECKTLLRMIREREEENAGKSGG
jgi:hypothetical protein